MTGEDLQEKMRQGRKEAGRKKQRQVEKLG